MSDVYDVVKESECYGGDPTSSDWRVYLHGERMFQGSKDECDAYCRRHRLDTCTICGARVPQVEAYPYPGHEEGCVLVAMWLSTPENLRLALKAREAQVHWKCIEIEKLEAENQRLREEIRGRDGLNTPLISREDHDA